jgi:hypothetical protein
MDCPHLVGDEVSRVEDLAERPSCLEITGLGDYSHEEALDYSDEETVVLGVEYLE